MDSVLFVKALLLICSCEAAVITNSRKARLSLAEPMPYYFYNNIDGNPGTYSYGYDVADPSTGNTQYRSEERYPNGTVVGSYGYVDAWGRPQRYTYVADERGYRVMRDPPKSPYVLQATAPSTVMHENQISEETSVTWSRPKKHNKNRNKPNNSLLNMQQVDRAIT